MDGSGTVGGGDSPNGSPASPALSEPLSTSSIPTRPETVAPMETLNDALRGTSVSAEAPPRRKMRGPLKEGDFFREHLAKISRDSLEDRKLFIEQLRAEPPSPPVKRVRPRREEPDKLYPLFQCFRGHQTCIQCYDHHSKKCRYCCTTKGSVVSLNKEKAAEYTNQYSCHEGRGWVIPQKDDFFCPDNSCQFCGPLDSVLNHITDAHSMTIRHFSYGDVIRIPLHLVGKYLVLRAEDGTAFVLWVDDRSRGKILSVVCAKQQPRFRRTRFTFELTYDLPPLVRSWLKGERWTPLYWASNPRVKPWDIVSKSIVNCGKNTDVTGIANADSNIMRSYVSSSNLGNMHTDNKNRALCVPWTFYDSYCGPKMWYGDLLLSISSPSNAIKRTT